MMTDAKMHLPAYRMLEEIAEEVSTIEGVFPMETPQMWINELTKVTAIREEGSSLCWVVYVEKDYPNENGLCDRLELICTFPDRPTDQEILEAWNRGDFQVL